MDISPVELIAGWNAAGMLRPTEGNTTPLDANGSRFHTVDAAFFEEFGNWFRGTTKGKKEMRNPSWVCIDLVEAWLSEIRAGNSKSSRPAVAAFVFFPEQQQFDPLHPGLDWHAVIAFWDHVPGIGILLKFWEPQLYKEIGLTQNEKHSQLNNCRP